MDSDEYMKDPRAKSMEGFIAGLAVLARHMGWGLQQKFPFGAEHDVFHIYVGTEKLPEASEDGLALVRLGFHVEDDGWAYFT